MMFVIYAHNDYRKENGSRIFGLYHNEPVAREAFDKLLATTRTKYKEDGEEFVDEFVHRASYPDGWGLNVQTPAGTVMTCIQINNVIFLLFSLDPSDNPA